MSLYQRIETVAAQVKPAVALKTFLLLPVYGAGWLCGKLARTVWSLGAWLWAAAKVGALDGWGTKQ